MRRARDVRDQLEGLMERVEIEPTTSHGDSVAIRKVTLKLYQFCIAQMLKISNVIENF